MTVPAFVAVAVVAAGVGVGLVACWAYTALHWDAGDAGESRGDWDA